MKKALKENDGNRPIVVSGNLLGTIIGYLKHKDFVDALSNGYSRNVVPKKPETLKVEKFVMEDSDAVKRKKLTE